MNNLAVLLSLLIGTVIPGVTSIVTNGGASTKLKALITAGLAAVTGALTSILTTTPHGTAQWEQIIATMLVAWIAAAAAYSFGWKVSGATSRLETATRTFGFGPRLPADLSE